MSKSEFTSEQKKLYSEQVRKLKSIFASGNCMFSGAPCSGTPISSHTISKSLYLLQIAEDNKVLSWETDHWAAEALSVTELASQTTVKASTFPGFCSIHDSSLFKCLDDKPFMATREQLFMFAYRTHCREVHCKKAQILGFPQPEDVARLHGHPEPEKAMHSWFAKLNIESMAVGERDGLIHHQRLDNILNSADYHRMCSCVIPFSWDAKPFMATAGSFYPDFDVTGKPIQDFGDAMKVLNTIHVTILPASGQSYAIFSFLDVETNGPQQLIESMIKSSRLGDLIAWLPFCYIENTVVRPSWWNTCSSEMKKAIKEAFHDGIDPTTSMAARIANCPPCFQSGIVPSTPFWT